MNYARVVLLILFFGCVAAPGQAPSSARDADLDGLDDAFEQQLLEKFQPQFMLGAEECDIAPATFAPNVADPTASSKDGTIYGQAFLHSKKKEAELIEIHYYHLWSRDCARLGHPLDAEYVAALVRTTSTTNSAEGSHALYWYSAAHEKTLCDGSSGAKASFLNAEDRGPKVWISIGKHASFLDATCTAACSRDRCQNASAMVTGKLINLGEPGRPLNGATWTSSKRWPLEAKMQLKFSGPYLAKLETSDGIIALNQSSDGKKGVIRRADMTAEAMEIGYDQTASAISVGAGATGEGTAAGYNGTKNSLRRAAGAVGRWFRGGAKSEKKQ